MRKFKHILNVLGVKFIEFIGPLLNDRLYLQWKWRFKMGSKLNLKNPQTFSEKLQWLKLYDRKPEYTTMVDKVKVKDYVAERIGLEYIIPTIRVWNTPEEIDFDSLPNQFVLKCNHNSGGLFICKDKTKITKKKWHGVLSGLRKSLKYNYYMLGREWPYKNVERKILAEKYIMDDSEGDLKDYKFFCFNGIAKFCQVISGRSSKMSVDFFDKEWRHQPFHEPRTYPFSNDIIEKPMHLEKMWEMAEKLADGNPFSRIDFYEVCGKVYFGEITFFPTNGMGGFDPVEWDYKFGEWINL